MSTFSNYGAADFFWDFFKEFNNSSSGPVVCLQVKSLEKMWKSDSEVYMRVFNRFHFFEVLLLEDPRSAQSLYGCLVSCIQFDGSYRFSDIHLQWAAAFTMSFVVRLQFKLSRYSFTLQACMGWIHLQREIHTSLFPYLPLKEICIYRGETVFFSLMS